MSQVIDSTSSLGLAQPFFSLLFNIFGSQVNDHNLGFCSFLKKYASSRYLFYDKNMIGPERSQVTYQIVIVYLVIYAREF
jgi:hypothetical protein